LVRNGVDHGIESPSDRITQGKPERATLTLHAERYGDSVKISIHDDGRGIDPKRIRETLQRKQLMPDTEITNLTEHQLIQQLFLPGFSTQVTVSHISGRGVGLDVVKSTVEKLGGNITVDSTVGIGTSFNLTLPISVALTYALLVRIHEGYFAFPIQSVEKVLQINRDDIISVGEGEAARMDDGSLLPLVGLGSILDFDETHNSNVVLLQHAPSKLCVRVDSILGVRQLVQANLPNFIRDVRIISGTSMIEGGMVVQFLNVVYLLTLAQEYRKRSLSGEKKKQQDVTRIMIAEDSDLTREMLVSRVSRMGYQVFEAVNGQDAWEQLTYREVDLIMTDLDMPLLNGFELIRKLRSDRKTQNIPIVVLSTRNTKESKQQAAQAGADAYIVKSAYNEDELQKTFTRLLTQQTI
jgi:chemotaxis protein histidine kinase CheA